MKTYAKGARLERLARQALETQGYTVIRSAGSKGPLDLVAVDRQSVRLIQVKAQGVGRPIDKQKLETLQVPPGTSRELWERVQVGARAGWKIQRMGETGWVLLV